MCWRLRDVRLRRSRSNILWRSGRPHVMSRCRQFILPGRSLRLILCTNRQSRLPQPENDVCDAILVHFSAVLKLAVCRNRCDTQRPTQRKTPQTIVWGVSLCWRLPILPGRFQPSIVGTSELNCCVRDGNRCTLTVINTN